MPRRLSALVSAVSLLGCVALCLLWARSYLPERLWVRWADGRLVLVGADGTAAKRLEQTHLDPHAGEQLGVRALLADLRSGVRPGVGRTGMAFPGSTETPPVAPPGPIRSSLLGLELLEVPPSAGGPPLYRVLTVPVAYLAGVAAALPAVRILRAVRGRRRDRAGHCAACGYDLRGTPERGGALLDRCPECGTVPPVVAAAAAG